MEMNSVDKLSRHTHPMQFDLYNSNRKMVYVDPLGKEFENNSGSIKINENEMFENGALIRLQYHHMDSFDFLTRPMYVFGKKINLSSYFSVNQYQSGIIDIPFGFKLSELDLKIPLCFMEHCMVTIFEGTSENKIHDDSSYALIENNSLESINVDLIELFKGGKQHNDINIINSNFVEGRDDYSMMRIWSKNLNQFEIPIFNKTKEGEVNIEPNTYLSPYQMTSNVIDITQKFDLSKTESIETTIMPKTKIMFHIL